MTLSPKLLEIVRASNAEFRAKRHLHGTHGENYDNDVEEDDEDETTLCSTSVHFQLQNIGLRNASKSELREMLTNGLNYGIAVG